MRIALIYPPLADATQPYSSLAALAGFLRTRGRHEVVLHDANLEFVLRMLTGERIAASAPALPEDDSPGNPRLKASIVRNGIEAAVDSLRSRATFLDLDRLNHALRIVQDAWEILRAGALRLELATWSIEEIERIARDRDANPFLPILEEVSLPALERAAPEAVGISITYRRQIIPAITLALLVRERMPHVPVILGGQIVSLWHPMLPQLPRLFDWCDYLIAFEGETALDALLSALEHGGPLDGVPNLAWRRGAEVRVNPPTVENIDALPAPDYDGLPLERYLAPEPVLLLNTSRGCYWSKCEFCSVSPSMRRRFRMRRSELVLDDIAALQARHGARCISFGDDCIPPRMLKALARGLPERGIEVSWQAEVRFEPQLDSALLAELRRSGCRNLIFGLESYVPRVLEAMNKGVRHGEIRRIVDDCRRHDIAVNLQLFFGFPGETAEDARRTMELAAGELHGAATLSFGTFRLQRGSGVARRPGAFGVHVAADSQPLAVELAYEPQPAHADAIRQELHATARQRTRFGSFPLGLDAHTLLYLRHAGVAAMAKEYYAPAAAAVSPDCTLTRRPGQIISRSILYDYDLDRAVELSDLALWLLDALDCPRSPRQLARKLGRATGTPARALLGTIREITGALLERGLVGVAAGLEPATT